VLDKALGSAKDFNSDFSYFQKKYPHNQAELETLKSSLEDDLRIANPIQYNVDRNFLVNFITLVYLPKTFTMLVLPRNKNLSYTKH